MRGRGDSDADMPNIPGSPGPDGPGLPEGLLDALLTGDLLTGDLLTGDLLTGDLLTGDLLTGDLLTDEAVAGLQPATTLLAALNAGPEDGELTGQAQALAEFRHRGGSPGPSGYFRHRRLITARLAVKVTAAAVAVAVLGGAAAAAYAGALPAPVQRLAHNAVGAPAPKASHGPATPQVTPVPSATGGPDATGPAAFGLCNAYAHAKAHGTAAEKSAAFRNLAAAAGGAANITAFCAAVPHPGNGQATATATAHGAGKSASHATGKSSASHATGKSSSAKSSH